VIVQGRNVVFTLAKDLLVYIELVGTHNDMEDSSSGSLHIAF